MENLVNIKMFSNYIIVLYNTRFIIKSITPEGSLLQSWTIKLTTKGKETDVWRLADAAICPSNKQAYIIGIRKNRPKICIIIVCELLPDGKSKRYIVPITLKDFWKRYKVDRGADYVPKDFGICIFPSNICVFSVSYALQDSDLWVTIYYRVNFNFNNPEMTILAAILRQVYMLVAKPIETDQERFFDYSKQFKGLKPPLPQCFENSGITVIILGDSPDITSKGIDMKEVIEDEDPMDPDGPFSLWSPYSWYPIMDKVVAAAFDEKNVWDDRCWMYYLTQKGPERPESQEKYTIHMIDTESETFPQESIKDEKTFGLTEQTKIDAIGLIDEKVWIITLNSEKRTLEFVPICRTRTLRPLLGMKTSISL
jgi:hypothetical protein